MKRPTYSSDSHRCACFPLPFLSNQFIVGMPCIGECEYDNRDLLSQFEISTIFSVKEAYGASWAISNANGIGSG